MAMLTGYSAYFDASGHPSEQDVLSVAGYVATVENWYSFDDGWNKILQGEGVKFFHATDFVNSRGEFSVGWKGETDRRRNFVSRLQDCLESNCRLFFRVSLFLEDYLRVNGDFELQEMIGMPYTICSMQCSHMLRGWAKGVGCLDNLIYYFEDGDLDKGDFEAHHKRAYGVNPKFLDKTGAVAFQASDFAAWKIRTALEASAADDHTRDKGWNLLRSLAILNVIPKEAGVLNEASLRTFCDRYNVARRK
ncbi:MAG: hypothetical protein ABSB30_04635 [Terracidiphilus sp.]|jgi:hypothetical protein